MKSFDDLLRVMAKLRSPKGCPWDRKQTHSSLMRYLVEETKEVAQAVRKKDDLNLEEELGDILLQVIFHAQIAKEEGRFTMDDVVKTLVHKLTLRHPHVFGYQPAHKKFLKGKSLLTEADVLANWDVLKSISKARPRRKRTPR